MKKITQNLLILTFVSAFLFSCSNDESEPINISTKKDISLNYTPIEIEITNLINDYRVNQGLPELKIFNIVSKEAINHTNYMIEIGEMNHDNFSVRYHNLVANANAKSAAENVAYGYTTAEAVVNAWINSDGHRHNIENPTYTHFGISTKSNSEGHNYFTNIFIKK